MKLLRFMRTPRFWFNLDFKHTVEPTSRGHIDHYTFNVGWAWIGGALYGGYRLVRRFA